jgi:hypothetical protein
MQRVTGRADFRVDLEAALQLRPVIMTERAVEAPRYLLGMLVEGMLHRLGRRRANIGHRAPEEAEQQHAREEEADERA